MKLKTRLVISFCTILLVPVLLLLIFMMTTGNRQLQYLEEYGNRLQQEEGINLEEEQELQGTKTTLPAAARMVPEIPG